MGNFIRRMKNVCHKPEKDSDITIDAVKTESINGKLCKKVSFWNNGARYSTLVDANANIPAVGESMPYSKLQEMKASMEKSKELEKSHVFE